MSQKGAGWELAPSTRHCFGLQGSESLFYGRVCYSWGNICIGVQLFPPGAKNHLHWLHFWAGGKGNPLHSSQAPKCRHKVTKAPEAIKRPWLDTVSGWRFGKGFQRGCRAHGGFMGQESTSKSWAAAGLGQEHDQRDRNSATGTEGNLLWNWPAEKDPNVGRRL